MSAQRGGRGGRGGERGGRDDGGRLAPADRGHDRDLAAIHHRGRESTGEADALGPDEHVDMLAYLTLLVDHAVPNPGMKRPQRLERFTHRRVSPAELHVAHTAREGAEISRNQEDDRHYFFFFATGRDLRVPLTLLTLARLAPAFLTARALAAPLALRA